VPSAPRRPGYTIAAVSKLTGIGCHTLRAWERRHGFPRPARSASGHRRYDVDEVRRLHRVAALVHQGQSIGNALAILEDRPDDCSPRSPADPLKLVDLLTSGEVPGSDRLYTRLAALKPPEHIATQLLEPALIEVGERWFRGDCGIHQERCATQFLVRKLHLLVDAAQADNSSPRGLILLGATRGERHEGGLLILATLLERAGYRTLVLGVDLPAQELRAAARRWKPDALALSFVLSRNLNRRFGELRGLVDVPIFVGGRSLLNYQRLARANGLIPLIGPARESIPALLDHLRQRSLATVSPHE
jgi:DNA-binding transcriptional MerR regulator